MDNYAAFAWTILGVLFFKCICLSFTLFLELIPIIDLQSNQYPNDDQGYLTNGIKKILRQSTSLKQFLSYSPEESQHRVKIVNRRELEVSNTEVILKVPFSVTPGII